MTPPKKARPTRASRQAAAQVRKEQECASQNSANYVNHLPPQGGIAGVGQGMAQGMGPGIQVPQAKPVSILSVHERVQKVQERLFERRSVWQDAVRQLEQADPLTAPNYMDLVMNASSLAHEYINATDNYRSVVGGLYQ